MGLNIKNILQTAIGGGGVPSTHKKNLYPRLLGPILARVQGLTDVVCQCIVVCWLPQGFLYCLTAPFNDHIVFKHPLTSFYGQPATTSDHFRVVLSLQYGGVNTHVKA